METKIELVQVELQPLDVEYFKLFMKYYGSIKKLMDEQVFELKSGNATLHFDHQGELKEVEITTKRRF